VVAMAEKLTVRFEEFDNDLDGNIVSSGPLVLYKTVDSITDLVLLPQAYGFPAKTATVTPNVVVFVKRVTGYSLNDPNNRGAYFKYNYEIGSWQEILLGTHSHENKELLDKLGNFALNKDTIGESYLTLDISAGDVDGNGNPLTYEYNVNWKSIPDNVLPDVPESETNLYLRVDADGNKQWVNDFVAAQNFQVIKERVLLGAGENSTYTITFDQEIFYDESLGDYALVWSDSLLISDKTILYNLDTKKITVTSATTQFNNNEYATLMIIRNGAAAAIAELAEDYVTKSELINVLSGGAVNLKDYATKSDLNNYAKRQHSHADLAKRDHNHDNRYAFFFHTHPEIEAQIESRIQTYLTMHPDVFDMLTQISETIENNQQLQTLIAGLNFDTDISEINSKIDDLNAMFDDNSNSPINIQLKYYLDNKTFNGYQILIEPERISQTGEIKNLEEILIDIYEKLDEEDESVETDEVYMSGDAPLQVKLADGVEVGSYSNGDQIEPNTRLTTVITNILQKQIIPEYIKPNLNIAWDVNQMPEVGSTINVSVVPGTPTKYHNEKILNYVLAKKVVGDTSVEILKNSSTLTNSAYTGSVSLLSLIEGGSLEIYATADYSEVEPIIDNFGNSYTQPNGTTEKDFKIVTPRRALLVSGRSTVLPTLDIQLPAQTSAAIRLGTTAIVRENYTTIDETYIAPTGTRSLVFAMPSTSGELSRILYKEQGDINILDLFTKATYLVEGANNYTAVNYTVYTYEFGRASAGPMTLRFVKG
jgi:hypothetical protein